MATGTAPEAEDPCRGASLLSARDLAASVYLRERHVPDLLDTAISELLAQRPADPRAFFRAYFGGQETKKAADVFTPSGHLLSYAGRVELVRFAQHVHEVELVRWEDQMWAEMMDAAVSQGLKSRETTQIVQQDQKKDEAVIKSKENRGFQNIEVAAGKRKVLSKREIADGQQEEEQALKRDEDVEWGQIEYLAGRRREITFRNIAKVEREEYGLLRKEEVDAWAGIERAAGKRVGWSQADYQVEDEEKPEWESGPHADFIVSTVPDVDPERMEKATAVDAVMKVENEARIVAVIGATGHGKSSLCCSLVGEKPGDRSSQQTFKIAATAAHVTETVQVLTGRRWMDNERACELFLIDTPGLHDERGVDKDAENIQEMIRVFKRLPLGVHAFLLCVTAEAVRFDDALMSTVRYFEEQFGRDFWHNVVFVVQRWEHHTIALMKREANGVSEEQRREQYLSQLEEHFPHARSAHIPFCFVDTHAHIYESHLSPEEKQGMMTQWHQLYRCVTQHEPHITNNMLMSVPSESSHKATELYGAAELALKGIKDTVDPEKPFDSLTAAILANAALQECIKKARELTPPQFAQQQVRRFRQLMADRIADLTRVHLARRDRKARKFAEGLLQRYQEAVVVPKAGESMVSNPREDYLREFDERFETAVEGTESARTAFEGSMDEHWGRVKTEWAGEVSYTDEDGDSMLFRPAPGADALQYLVNGAERPPFKRLVYQKSLGIPGITIPDLGRGFRLPVADARRVLGGLRVLALRVNIECNIEEDEEVPEEEGLPQEDADKLVDGRVALEDDEPEQGSS